MQTPAATVRSGDGRMTARGLPDGWVAVYSAEHQRDYFWHRLSGATSWSPPELKPVPGARPPEVPADLDLAALGRGELGRRLAGIRGRYKAGEELQGQDFALVRKLLDLHPEHWTKIGSGVRAIKLDASLHESGSTCFWLLRTDGSAEDFSTRKCLAALEEPRELGGRPAAGG